MKQTSDTSKTKKTTQYVFNFGSQTDGNAKMRELLGGKGANLAEMAAIGLPVPPGFTISTEVCTYFYAHERSYPKTLSKDVKNAINLVEKQMKREFGSRDNPLLVSVRSGARDSMPGMMDTILNLGLNDETVEGLSNISGNPRFAWDCYRRFIQMYGDVVMGVQAANEESEDPFHALLDDLKKSLGKELDNELTADELKQLVERYKLLISKQTGKSFPQDVYEQLWGAVGAVFGSWKNDRAILYRQQYGIPAEWGTAVNVQAMVFGNAGDDSGTGVAFTRDPATGEKVFYGEYLTNAQGEDVVAGVRTPKAIAAMAQELPKNFADLEKVRARLEKHFKDMQDFEFTIENGRLFILQTRNGKRTGLAAIRIAVEMNKEKLIDQKTALLKIPAESVDTLLVPVFDEKAQKAAQLICKGLPAGPGAATGRIAFTAAQAEVEARKGNKVILCRSETSPDDLKGMLHSQGILTTRGGVSSHAALVARQLGKVCVCGAGDITINYEKKTLTANGIVLKEGDYISINGTTGSVYKGLIESADSEVKRVLEGTLKPSQSYTYELFQTVMDWSDKYRRLRIRTNADTPAMAQQAVAFGAEGIGLCRTEHMFFEGSRIDDMRQMILAVDGVQRREALKKLLPMQKKDFVGLFKAMAGRPVTIRLLDPPLHEFLPQDDAVRRQLADKLGLPLEFVIDRIKALHEENPMLGCRGCRLGILYPEITEMQVQAIFEAVAEISTGKNAIEVHPEIMIPLVGFKAELADQLSIVRRVADEVMKKKGIKIKYMVGTMVEVPRAAITADEIAEHAEFFSFGTNDLTQTTLGLSRDDMGMFYDEYQQKEIYSKNPFASLDKTGVGKLMQFAVANGLKTRKDLKLGICGEHAGDPDSIDFCHNLGLNYVSCSPPRVPIARLAAAQAALRSA
ncbi:pyruvate, phosphate dikinase [Pseudohongiella sp. SYSU M77423]|uniref:pyruvate, phosphate dikinase n=1 Tax=Pseudohongiella sp. SYSU M77423 TaxID=3042312 RepID=UPI000C8E1E32|nr:pyruvate, phosphate dikinase [Pseudohongiella sp. SYSU M77423]MAY57109.1 pyruvate, phosphate dikinase [Gammaproteobacteria bacterium]MDH7942490.1 pyruvate, phosphate dikinase [Pseudohongiella sp. SYSU M77423]HBN15111.1 pyruvate, phosphate dikinase [Pseudohongiella sp.]|tara:strand:+ start:628 stop:3360 length:2733 start_codon:yes stop_codon:yes gene_type:complete